MPYKNGEWFNEGPRFPTVSWRRGTVDSKTHYQGDSGKTLCGAKIPKDLYDLEAGDGLMCDRCARLAEAGPRPEPAAAPRKAPVVVRLDDAYPDYLETDEDRALYDEGRRMARQDQERERQRSTP